MLLFFACHLCTAAVATTAWVFATCSRVSSFLDWCEVFLVVRCGSSSAGLVVRLPFQQRRFSGDCSFFYFYRLPSKFAMGCGTLFGCLLGMIKAPMLKCTCNPSAAAGRMDKVCCAPFQTTLLVKNVRFEKTAQK